MQAIDMPVRLHFLRAHQKLKRKQPLVTGNASLKSNRRGQGHAGDTLAVHWLAGAE